MSAIAIFMMALAIVTVWGGLVLAIINIRRSPEENDELDAEDQVVVEAREHATTV